MRRAWGARVDESRSGHGNPGTGPFIRWVFPATAVVCSSSFARRSNPSSGRCVIASGFSGINLEFYRIT